ncbi:hypothetical protein [Candidatus Poriferisodalis sp.]|uniref:hypothetical protein n=1 Tax=Candidatus Poriferisodalis sp. TaxID=3101277 RepID=UPI003B5C6A86
MAIDEIERNTLVNKLITTLGEDPAATLMKTVWPHGTDNLATKDDLREFATKDDLRNFATKDDLRNFATKDDLRNFATKDDLREFATKDDLRNFATNDDLRALEEGMRAYVDSAIARQTRTIMLAMAGFMTALMAPLYAGLLA